MINEGADGIFIGDDYGSNFSPLLAPEQYRKHVFPQLARMAKTLKGRKDFPVMLHSDGHIRPLLDDIATMEINGLHPIERSANMDLKEIKETYGHKFCIMGNININLH